MSGETESQPSGWTVDTALEHILVQHRDLRDHLEQELAFTIRALDERYATQTKALDAAFIAQQTAMQTAFTAADRAVQAALESAEKAVSKAEIANEKRFEATNEFRAQLGDQAGTFVSRSEADVRFRAISDKLADETTRVQARFAETQHRLDINSGRDQGNSANQAKIFAVIGAVGGVIGIFLGLVALIAVFRT